MPAADRAREVLLLDGTEEGDLVERALEGGGIAPHRVRDVAGAEGVLSRVRPDLIVVGLETEGALGLCGLVRALPRGGTAAILLVGGPEDGVGSTAEAILRGADGYLTRPVAAEELLDKVEALIGPLPGRGLELDAGFDGIAATLPLREPTQVLPDPSAGPIDRLAGLRIDDHAEATAETELRAVTDLATGVLEAPPDAEGSQASTRAGARASERAAPGQPAGLRRPPSAFPRSSHAWSAPRPGLDGPASGLPAPPSGILRPEGLFEDSSLLGDDPFAHLSEWPDEGGRDGAREPDQWDEPPRPERTHVLGRAAERPGQPAAPRGPGPARAAAPGPPSLPGAEAELSDEFRRVIDEVALRLFPEDELDDFGDEAFDELRTVVPVVGDPRAPMDEDLDDFSIDSMETFAGSEGGLTLSLFDEPTRPRDLQGEPRENEPGAPPVVDDAPEAPAPEAPAPEARPGGQPGGGAWGASWSGPGAETPGAVATDAPEPIPALRIRERSVSHGDLAEHPVPVLLAACLEAGLRARLVLRRGGGDEGEGPAPPRERVVVLEGGRPIMASSTDPADRLFEMLRLQGRLTAAQHERCRALVESTGRRPGAVLVELGLARPAELLPLVRWHFAEILFAAFSWREGAFRLEPLAPGFRPRIQVERSGADLLLEGLRRRYVHEELVPLLGGNAGRPRRRSSAEPGRSIGLLPAELPLLALCDGTRSLDQLVEASGLERTQACAVLYGLALLGHLEVEDVGELPRLDTKAADRGADRAQLEERIQQSRSADYFSILGLRPDATTYEVRLAHERRSAELSEARLAELGATDLEPLIAEVRYVVDEALDVLGDEALRKAYRLARFGPGETAPP